MGHEKINSRNNCSISQDENGNDFFAHTCYGGGEQKNLFGRLEHDLQARFGVWFVCTRKSATLQLRCSTTTACCTVSWARLAVRWQNQAVDTITK